MKIKLANNVGRYDDENIWVLLVNCILNNSEIFETPTVSSDTIPDKIGDIRITSLHIGKTFEDVIDRETTTIVEGCALVALNCYPKFRLILNSDGFGLLVHLRRQEVLHKLLIRIEE